MYTHIYIYIYRHIIIHYNIIQAAWGAGSRKAKLHHKILSKSAHHVCGAILYAIVSYSAE